jgi:protein required for attachment to host cells
VLFEDGLVSADGSLTPRGWRRLGKAGPRPSAARGALTFGVLVADAVRARVLILRGVHGEHGPTTEPLLELGELTRPDHRAHDSTLFPGGRPAQRGFGIVVSRHGVADRREQHRRASEERFAHEAAGAAVQLWRANGVHRAVLVASPAMLGMLRPALRRAAGRAQRWSLRELASDLSRLGATALHDALADAGLLPPRGRMAPVRPIPGSPA